MNDGRRTDLSRVHSYTSSPRNLILVNLDETYNELYESSQAQVAFRPPAPEVFYTSRGEQRVSFPHEEAGVNDVAVFIDEEPAEGFARVGRFIVAAGLYFEIVDVALDGTVTCRVPQGYVSQQPVIAARYQITARDNLAAVDEDGTVHFFGVGPDRATLRQSGELLVFLDGDGQEQTVYTIVDAPDDGDITVTPQALHGTSEDYYIRSPDNSIQIAADGVVTFNGHDTPSADQIAVDNRIIIGDNVYRIGAVNAGVATVDPAPPAAIGPAEDYRIVELTDYYDDKGFTVTARQEGRVDVVLDFGGEWSETLAVGGFIHDCNVRAFCQRIRQSSVVRQFKVGQY